MQHNSASLSTTLGPTETETGANTSGNDLLSAALCAAGLDEFFVTADPSTEPDQQPTTSASTSAPLPTLVENCQELRAANTPVAGITASASTSPDLPINAASQSNSAGVTVVSSAQSDVSRQPVVQKPAKLIRIVRADGKPVLLQVGSAVTGAPSAVQTPMRLMVAPIPPVVGAETTITSSVVDGKGIGAAQIGIPEVIVTAANAFQRQVEIVSPAVSNQNAHQGLSSERGRPAPPPSTYGGLRQQLTAPSVHRTLGRSRLIPAQVPSPSSSQVRPVATRGLLPPPSTVPKRSRLVHFNHNVDVIRKGPPLGSSGYSSSSRIQAVQIRQRFAIDHEKNVGPLLGSGGMSMVGPVQPSIATRPATLLPSSLPPVVSITTPLTIPLTPLPRDITAGVEQDDDEEELGLAETYADYVPAKLRSGLSHPDQVVETSSLSSVLPPDIHYHCSIPEEVIDTGKLSALQLEAVIYACQKTEIFMPSGERTGYLIGDGPGVGKGRTIAAFIYENYLLGRKRALWFSVSSDLKFDAERDLRDIGAGRIKVYALNKFKYAKISGKENGSVKKGVIFATYASLIGESSSAKSKYRSRLKQLVQWCGKDFDGVIVFDECHRAKNLVPSGSTKPTKTGQVVLELQKAIPKGRVLYASATGATETRNMAYMTRLGLWGEGKPFRDFHEFIAAVEKRGVGAMEVVAMDMKLRGLYLARQLSFAGVTFRIEEVPLSQEFVKVYDESVKLWLEARKQFLIASELVDPEKGQKKAMWSQFWAAHQRFFKYLCIAAKVMECVKMVRENVKNGKCVVIGLQSTGEARTLDQLEESGGELTDFVSTAKGVFQALVEKHFPTMDDSKPPSRATRKAANDRNLFFDDDMDDFFGDLKPDNKRSWKRKLVAEHREKKKMAKMEKQSDDEDDEDEWRDSSSSGSDKEDMDDGSDGGQSSDEEGSGGERNSEDEEEEEVEDSFNPFADDTEEADPWESKLLSKTSKRKKKRKSVDMEEHDEELERQLEKALEEVDDKESEETPAVEKPDTKVDRMTQPVSASEFLTSTSSYMTSGLKPGRFALELGLDKVQLMKAELLAGIERLGDILPPNTLDQLIDELGGPEYVAEMTGRKGRVVNRDDGGILYELRNDDCDVPLELLNIAEREKFMNSEKHIAIISEAASSGISLQSDRRAKNQRRRVHITLELPWSADKAVQQFGRTHRSNQVSAPEYIFLISELAGEHRFASIVAKRLESLGALTHGDRRATESRDLSQFNLDTKYGREALDITLKSIIKQVRPIVKPPTDYKGEFFGDMRQYLEGVGVFYKDQSSGFYLLEKDANLSKFLNRLLGLPVMAQNSLFQYFSDTLREVVDQAKRDCRYDLGIMDIGHGGETVRKTQTVVFYGKFELGSLKTELHTVMVERGISWEAAMEIYQTHSKTNDGFYVSTNISMSSTVILVCDTGKKRADSSEQLYHVYRPNVGMSIKQETIAELKKRFRKVSPEKAETVWKKHFDASAQMCQHEYWFGRCRANESAFGGGCDVGRRKRAYHILSGSVLTVWNTVEDVLSSLPGRRQSRMQVVRLRSDKGQKIVGILVPAPCKKTLIDRLSAESSHTRVEIFE